MPICFNISNFLTSSTVSVDLRGASLHLALVLKSSLVICLVIRKFFSNDEAKDDSMLLDDIFSSQEVIKGLISSYV